MMRTIDIQFSAKKCRWSAAKDASIIYDSDMSFMALICRFLAKYPIIAEI